MGAGGISGLVTNVKELEERLAQLEANNTEEQDRVDELAEHVESLLEK